MEEQHSSTLEPVTPAKAGAAARIGAVLLALVLAIIAAVAIATMTDVSEQGVCEEVTATSGFVECYEFSADAEPIVLGFGWAGGIVLAIAALLALAFAVRGRGGRPLLLTAGVGVALLAVSILVAQLA